MTVSHNTETKPRMYPALKVMESKAQPLKCGRPPYWRAPLVLDLEDIYIPTWDWSSPLDHPEGEAVTVLEMNGRYLHALATVPIAHSHLRHTNAMSLPDPRKVVPGYYLVTVPYWAFGGTLVHPLGNSPRVQREHALWITAPTLALLLELDAQAHVGAFQILDSYTADLATDFRSWAERLRSVRTEYMDAVDMAHTETIREQATDRLTRFTRSCALALMSMLTGVECHTRRPDWAHTIYAQHAASLWRAAWRWTDSGRPVIAMSAADEISVLSTDIPRVMSRPIPPLQIDPTGRQVGAFSPSRVTFIGCEMEQSADSLTTLDDTDDTP